MRKLKVVTVVGTRPEIIRLSRLIPKLDEYTDHILVHTGQNYDPLLSDVFFRDLELRKPDYYLGIDSSSLGKSLGAILVKTEEVLLKEMPDAMLILGDTNSSICALISERMKIPVYHMEAGNRGFDNKVPEELNRKFVDHIASHNLAYTEHARRNLIAEGISPDSMYKVGSPMHEILLRYQKKIKNSQILDKLGLEPREYFVASFHREENVDNPERLGKLLNCLAAINQEWGLEIVVSTHPRTQKRLGNLRLPESNGIRFLSPFGFFDYSKLQSEAKCVISDSGSISEESLIMGFPAVTIRDSMERPEALEMGQIVTTGLDPDTVVSAINFRLNQKVLVAPPDYMGQSFSESVIGILLSNARRRDRLN